MSDEALRLLETELSDPASFDEGVEASRNACAAGASIAAAAITAAAYYDNPITGLYALQALMSRLHAVPNRIADWQGVLSRRQHPETDDADFTPGFGFVTTARAERAIVICRRVAELTGTSPSSRCRFMAEHHRGISEVAGPLNETGLAALVYLDADLDIDGAQRHWLSLKLAVALAEGQKARRAGIEAFPFSFARYVYEGHEPAPGSLDLAALKRQLGLEGTHARAR
jgi:hypothetical protein